MYGANSILKTHHLSASPALLSCQTVYDNKSSVVLETSRCPADSSGQDIERGGGGRVPDGQAGSPGRLHRAQLPHDCRLRAAWRHHTLSCPAGECWHCLCPATTPCRQWCAPLTYASCFATPCSFSGSPVVSGWLSFLMTEALQYNYSASPRERSSNSQIFLSDLCRRPV